MDFKRLDGRSAHDIRPLQVHLNPLKSGPSCRITLGNFRANDGSILGIGKRTSVLALLYQSGESKSRNSVCNLHMPTFEVFIRPDVGATKSHDRAIEAIVLKLMQKLVDVESLGRITISLRIQILEDAGGLMSVCLNALITCLNLSGLKINPLPYAISFGIIPGVHTLTNSEIVIIDPTREELDAYCSTSVTIVCEPYTGSIQLISIDFGCGTFNDKSSRYMVALSKYAAVNCISRLYGES